MRAYRYKDLLKSLNDWFGGSQEDGRHAMARLLFLIHWEKREVLNAGANLQLTLGLHADKTIRVTGTGTAWTITLPLADAAAVGFKCKIVIGEVNTSNWLIKAARGADVFKGLVLGQSATDSATDAPRTWKPGATDDTITLNGTTTGGTQIGDSLEFECAAVNLWVVRGLVAQSGVEATMFSDTVA